MKKPMGVRAVPALGRQPRPCEVRCMSELGGGVGRGVVGTRNAVINMGDFSSLVCSHKHMHTYTARLFPSAW